MTHIHKYATYIRMWIKKQLYMYCCCCSVFQSCPTLCDPMDCTPGLFAPHHHLEFAQVHVFFISDAIQPSHPLTPSSPSASIFPSIRDFSNESSFVSDDQNTASASVLPVSIQGWSPLRLTGLISLLFRGHSGVFSSTIVGRHQFFGVLPSFHFSSHNHVWSLGRPWPCCYCCC